MTVFSVVIGTNADLIAHISPLYIPPGSVVRDVTWGKGAFWSKTDTDQITLQGSDIAEHIGGHNGIIRADFCDLPDADSSADVVVLDPPYIHNPGKHVTDSRYNNAATTAGMYHRDIRALYVKGMEEAIRVLKTGGRLLVKGKDEVESGKQCWSHAELREDAENLGLYARDMFILVPQARTSMNRWSTQKHARKVHSFLWVFDKVSSPRKKPPLILDEYGEPEKSLDMTTPRSAAVTIKIKSLDGSEMSIDIPLPPSFYATSVECSGSDGAVSRGEQIATTPKSRKRVAPSEPSSKEVREWAASKGIEVSPTGRLSKSILEQYRSSLPNGTSQ